MKIPMENSLVNTPLICDRIPHERSAIESLSRSRCFPDHAEYTSSIPISRKKNGME
jgi:hypothetical protein